MRFQCPFCLFIITADDGFIGDPQRPRINCPNCSKTVFIPTKRFEEGYVVADFCIQRKIGEGSIGAVFEATQISLNRQVALKILFEEYTNTKGVKDFIREARVIAALSHPNLVQCYAVGEEAGICYMAMDYIRGESVKTKMRKDGKVQLDEALHVTQQVSEALYYAWDEAKVIHRDVKPDNIMINDEGVVKLTDLGLAMHHADWEEDMEISGSPSYMSPEQFAGEPLDTRSDIYSLGVTLYQMLSGHLPFEGETIKTIAKQHFNEDAVSLTKLDVKIPQKVSALVTKMIAKHPDDRFQSMEDLLNAIWMVRQRTAPDKSLIPDVHTISMKRLDYELQKETVRRQVEVSKTITGLGMKIAGIVLPLVAIIAVIIFYSYYDRQSEDDKKRREVDAIGVHLRGGDLELDILLKRTQEQLVKYQQPKTPLEHELKAKLKFYLSQINNRKLQERFNRLVDDLDSSQKALKKQLQHLSKKQTNQKKKTDLFKDQKLSYEIKITTLQKELNNMKQQQRRISKMLKATAQDKDDMYLDNIRLKVYNLLKKGKFRKAQILLKNEASVISNKHRKWLNQYMARVKRLDELHDLLTDSGATCAEFEIEGYGKIVAVDDGMIRYLDNSSMIKERAWDDFSIDTLATIVVNATCEEGKKKRDINEVKAEIAILLGYPNKAKDYQPENEEYKALYMVLKEFYSDSSSKKKKKSKSSQKSGSRSSLRENRSRMDVPDVPDFGK